MDLKIELLIQNAVTFREPVARGKTNSNFRRCVLCVQIQLVTLLLFGFKKRREQCILIKTNAEQRTARERFFNRHTIARYTFSRELLRGTIGNEIEG